MTIHITSPGNKGTKLTASEFVQGFCEHSGAEFVREDLERYLATFEEQGSKPCEVCGLPEHNPGHEGSKEECICPPNPLRDATNHIPNCPFFAEKPINN